MLDHVGIKVKSIARARAFYDAALRPLGLTPQYDFAVPASKKRFVGYGTTTNKTCLWIGTSVGVKAKLSGPVHICLAAKTRQKVHAFYEAAIAAGGGEGGAFAFADCVDVKRMLARRQTLDRDIDQHAARGLRQIDRPDFLALCILERRAGGLRRGGQCCCGAQ